MSSNNPESTSYNIWGYIIGIFSGFFAALATTLLRLVGKENKPEQMMFYFFLFTAILGLIVGVTSIRELTRYEFIIILLVSFTGLMYQFGLTYALKMIEVRIVTSIMLSSVVFAGIIDYLLKGVPVELSFLIGAIVMVLGIISVIRFNN